MPIISSFPSGSSSGSGILPHITVQAPVGSTVTAKNGGTALTAEEINGIWEFEVPRLGTWTVTAEKDKRTASADIEVDSVQRYKMKLSYFIAYLHVYAPAGATITCAGNGETQSIVSTGEDTLAIYAAGNYTVTRNKGGKTAERTVTISKAGTTTDLVLSMRYGYRKKKAEADPYARIEYLYDAVGMTPAKMNFTTGTFDYGDWGDAWFVKKNKPVMQKSDLTEDYELDHNDHTKKLDGTPSDVSNIDYDGNAMSAIPLCWWLRYEEDGYEYYIVCERQWDDGYKAYAHTRADGSIEDYFYWGMFAGSGSKAKIRSLKGQPVAQSLTAQEQIDGATANGFGWYIHSWSRRECIKDLLVLMAKTTDTQTAYGKGNLRSSSYGDMHTAGGMSDKGQFWGSADSKYNVKVFYIERFWGDQWDRTSGIINNKGSIYYKMTPEGKGYRIDDVEGYTDSGVTISETINKQYISATKCGEFGCIPTTFSGSESTFECDGAWSNTTQLNYLFAGAGVNTSPGMGGAFTFNVSDAPSTTYWAYGCGLSSDMPPMPQLQG